MLCNLSTCASRRSATAHKVLDQGPANLFLPIATIPQQENYKFANGFKFNTVNHAAAVTFDRNKFRMQEYVQVCRQCVVWHIQLSRNVTRRQAARFVLYQNTERIQPRRLSQSRQAIDGDIILHMSRIIDTICDSQVTCVKSMGRERGKLLFHRRKFRCGSI